MRNLKNSVQLLGHIGAKPEVKEFESGKKIAKFTLATNESFKNNKGEKVENTEWHNIVVWDARLVNLTESYLDKGSQVLLEGKLTSRAWENKEGNTSYTTEIIVNDIFMLGSKK
jgi:single-strand DNA-binding protein